MGNDIFISCAELARRCDVSRAAVKKAIDDGRITQAIVGTGRTKKLHARVALFEFAGEGGPANDAEKQEIASYAPPKKKATKKKAAKKAAVPKVSKAKAKDKGASVSRETPASEQPIPDLDGLSAEDEAKVTNLGQARTLGEARAIKEDYLARTAKLDYEKKAGQLLDAEEVYKDQVRVGKALRDGILGIPDRVAASMAAALGGKATPAIVHGVLESELRNMLIEVVNACRIEPDTDKGA